MNDTPSRYKGRGALSNPDCRFDDWARESFDDGWTADEEIVSPQTVLITDATRTVIVRNQSPDVPFSQSINPYRGCEHGCIYCFARPSHAYLGMSPGLDFETRILIKPDTAAILQQELAKPGYRCEPIALGSNTDPYQPVERKLKITRSVISVLHEHHHPLAIITKSALIERDIDLLSAMARENLVQVMISVTTLDRTLARLMEPRAAAPQRRLQTIARLHEAGIPVGVLIAPVVPTLNEHELELILEQCAKAGAKTAAYILLRLPQEVAPLFSQWLQTHYPLKANRILNHVRDMRGGKLYDSTFGHRMVGSGNYAAMVRRRFDTACRRSGFNLNKEDSSQLNCSLFKPPVSSGRQISLFESI